VQGARSVGHPQHPPFPSHAFVILQFHVAAHLNAANNWTRRIRKGISDPRGEVHPVLAHHQRSLGLDPLSWLDQLTLTELQAAVFGQEMPALNGLSHVAHFRPHP
jgi:hypothetical protein